MKKHHLLTALALGGLGLFLLQKKRQRRIPVEDRTVLITGGSRGLGLVLARVLVRRGARVAICARNEAELERARRDLEARGGEVLAIPCDVGVPRQVRRMVAEVERSLGPIDFLVNNAGIIQVGPAELMTRKDFEQAMSVHLWGPLNTIEAVLPGMRSRGEGSIVNIVSLGGRMAVPHLLPYLASKHALSGLSRGLQVELERTGIRVTTIYPGMMRTGSPYRALFKGRHQDEFTWFAISGALPGVTMSAPRAARRIIEAMEKGESEVVLSLAAKAGSLLQELSPGLMRLFGSLATRLMPGPSGGSTRSFEGRQSRSRLAPSTLTTLQDRAAMENNELSPGESIHG